MKIIKYNLCTKVNRGSEEDPRYEDVLTPVMMSWSEDNVAIAEMEAHEGEYTIEDDGVEEIYQPTESERLEALEAALLELMGVNLND